jgi:ABC-2 type transport system ATP-binding protein
MTILLSTHYMKEAEQLCDEVIFLREGQILAQGDPDTLKREVLLGDRVELTVEGEGWQGLKGLPGVLACTREAGRVRVVVDDARKRLPELLRHLDESGVPVTDVTVAEPTLESVFLRLAR